MFELDIAVAGCRFTVVNNVGLRCETGAYHILVCILRTINTSVINWQTKYKLSITFHFEYLLPSVSSNLLLRCSYWIHVSEIRLLVIRFAISWRGKPREFAFLVNIIAFKASTTPWYNSINTLEYFLTLQPHSLLVWKQEKNCDNGSRPIVLQYQHKHFVSISLQ